MRALAKSIAVSRKISWCLALALLGTVGNSFAFDQSQAARPSSMGNASNANIQLAQAGTAKPATPQAELDALIKAAKAEGEVTFYTGAPENVAKRIGDAFTAKYGIKTQFVRLSGTPMLTRFASEAAANNIAVDLMLGASNVVPFAEDAIKKGWVESISSAGVPALVSGEFPKAFNRGPTAIVQLAPWVIVYNTDKVKSADIPKDWPDVLNPKWKGQILINDPRTSTAFLDIFDLLFDKYGEPFFQKLRAQNPRFIKSVAVIESLAAGEGAITFPQIVSVVQVTKERGAPLDVVTPDLTTGVEMQVILTARSKAKHPNAARLLANYILTQEGNKVMNSDPGAVTMYDTTRLPRQYTAPKNDVQARKDMIYKLLGLEGN